MTKDSFELCISQGKKYVLYYNYVLDIGSFADSHPGGKFILDH